MTIVQILLALFLPPVAVLLERGIGLSLLINIILTLIFWLPGTVHAFLVIMDGGKAKSIA